jgi:hypothetical protein
MGIALLLIARCIVGYNTNSRWESFLFHWRYWFSCYRIPPSVNRKVLFVASWNTKFLISDQRDASALGSNSYRHGWDLHVPKSFTRENRDRGPNTHRIPSALSSSFESVASLTQLPSIAAGNVTLHTASRYRSVQRIAFLCTLVQCWSVYRQKHFVVWRRRYKTARSSFYIRTILPVKNNGKIWNSTWNTFLLQNLINENKIEIIAYYLIKEYGMI